MLTPWQQVDCSVRAPPLQPDHHNSISRSELQQRRPR